ncbi:MAG TPA: glycosyl hydrolase family 8 [Chitinispirillaceae bacterium]|nr:glycosyl hydrolase family 8 [Chitinispirillaceae bacterium]
MKKIVKLASILCFLSIVVSAQQRPFPQNIRYPYGVIPKTLDADWLKSEYSRWKSESLITCNDSTEYVKTDTGGKVEAVGFGMLIFAYMNEKTHFDGLYNFYKKNCCSNAGDMMGWIGTCSGSNICSASDGDVDVAFSLIIASWQWPDGGYVEKAKDVIKNLKKVVTPCGNVLALHMGINGTTVYNGCNEVDISYYNPAAFREFAKVTGDSSWNQLAEDTYTILYAGANATTGLVTDRQSVSGSPNGMYAYDACRTPWRICLDYLWNGNEKARAWCKKVSDWAYSVGPDKITDGYQPSGASNNGYHNMAFTGGFAVAAMANSQEIADAFGTSIRKIKDTHWFPFTLTPCYLLTLTGNQWRNDLLEKQDSTTLVQKKIVASTFADAIRWSSIGDCRVLVSGLAAGNSLTLVSLSGKLLYQTTATGSSPVQIQLTTNNCSILTVRNENGMILKTGLLH